MSEKERKSDKPESLEKNNVSESKTILNLAISVGEVLLKSGGEIYRVQETVSRILESYGIKDYHVFVITNGIFATVYEQREDAGSMVRYVTIGEVNLERVAKINQLSREIWEKKCTVQEAYERLEQCREASNGAGKRGQILACGVGSAGFCYLLGGRPYDAMMSFFLGVLLEMFLLIASKHHMSRIIMNILGSALITTGSLMLYAVGAGILSDKIIIGGIIPLVPGVALTTGIRDLFGGDYLSGSIRLIDALLTGMCIAIGVGAAIKIFQLLGGGGLPI
ncbi:MAG: threonine/serine exporter family protein [Lachnospiraceae bacterium]|nr:threonine/serine exporter family protein [Lachnospiraceae bacterium]